MIRISRHPLAVLGAGLAFGYIIYKYRGAILARARSAAVRTDAIMSGARERLDRLDSGDAGAGSGAAGV